MSITDKIKNVLNELGNFLFKERESYKRTSDVSIEEILNLPKPTFVTEKNGVYSLFSYKEKIVKDMIWELKYYRNKKVLEKLSLILTDHIRDDILNQSLFNKEKEYILLGTPITKRKLNAKGFCHIDLLCKEMMKNLTDLNIEYLPDSLKKIRETKEQNKIKDRKERLENLKGSFWADQKTLAGKSIILIDDVTTTGATINEIVKTLKSIGVKDVRCYTVAN